MSSLIRWQLGGLAISQRSTNHQKQWRTASRESLPLREITSLCQRQLLYTKTYGIIWTFSVHGWTVEILDPHRNAATKRLHRPPKTQSCPLV